MDTQSILFADSQPADAGLVLLFSPDGIELEAARVVDSPAGAPRVMEAAVLRPINLSETHGVNIRREDLAEMARAYDPGKVEAAALNFDHAWGGPSHGWATKLWLEGELLWARFENLSQEAADAVASGRWPRRSSEFWLKHPQTGGAYLTGLALLGNASPACSGLPPARLMARQPIRIDLSKETPMELAAPLEVSPDPPPIEDTVLPPTVEETPAAPAAAAPAGDDGDPGDAVALAARQHFEEQSAQLEADRAQLAADRAALAADTVAARRERVAIEVDRDLARLNGLPPAALRTGLRGALIELRLAEPLAVQLSADQGGGVARSVPVADILLAALATLPPIGVLESAQLAPASGDPTETAGDHRTESERQVHLRARLDDNRYLELRQKYGFSEIN